MRHQVLSSLTALLFAGLSSVAVAQDAEPNRTCALAQDAGRVGSGLKIMGSLDVLDADPRSDVDYFSVGASPGRRLNLRTSAGIDLREGVFDKNCKPVPPDVDGNTYTVPPSGVLFVAVGSADDEQLDGNGTKNPGAYQVVLRELADVGSISGRVLDARTGTPLAFAEVNLEQCVGLECWTLARVGLTDSLGGFRFQGIEPGSYRFFAGAIDYEPTVSVQFRIDEREGADTGELLLLPARIQCVAR